MQMKFYSRLGIFFSLFALACNEDPVDPITLRTEDTFRTFTMADGLNSNSITSLYEDPDGILWIGTDEGLNRFNGSSFQSFTPANSEIIPGPILATAFDKDGNLWVGSPYGYSIYDGTTWQTEGGIALTAFFLDPEDNFWIGSYGYGGVILKKDGSVDDFYDYVCEGCNYIMNFFPDEKDNIWITTFGGAYRYSNGTYKLFEKITANFLLSGLTDNWGNVWFASYESHNLVRITDNKLTLQPIPALPEGGTTSLARVDDKIYIAGVTGELFVFDGTVARRSEGPLKDEFITTMLSDSKGNLWLGTENSGIIKFTPKESF